MKNKVTDLNDHLMAQIERLTDEGLHGAKLEDEIARAKALAPLASNVIQNAALLLDGAKFAREWKGTTGTLPKSLELLGLTNGG